MLRKMHSHARLLSGAAVVSTALLLHGTAYAQTEPALQEEGAASAGEGEIVITGTLLTNPEIEQSSPVTAISREEISLRQINVVEELLRTIPGVVPDIGSAINNGNQGASFVNLRGLGSNRNLVLLDGARITPAGLSGAVDLNNIPPALIERVDILTGGASTTYGADAVSGVVNFITRGDFEGAELLASNQINEQGDGRVFRTDLTLGANLAGGRGNAVLSLGYIKSDAVFQGDRDFAAISLDPLTGLEGGFSTTAAPSRFSGVRNLEGTANATLQIDPATGALVPTYQLFNFNAQNAFQTPFSRINVFGKASFEASEDFELYAQGMFSKNEVSTLTASTGTFGIPVEIPLSNPYMPAAARGQFCAADVDPRPAVYTPRFTPTECAAAAMALSPQDPAYRSVTVSLFRRIVETGARRSEFTTTLFDYRAGIRGDITSSLQFDVHGSYGESENDSRRFGISTFSRLQQAILATNTTTCLDNSNGCVPINLFGPAGSITPDQLEFLGALTANGSVTTSLAQVRGLVSGDFGWVLPWAQKPVSIAMGAEYRRYRAELSSDSLTQTPGEVLGGISAQPDTTGGYSVKEGFVEIIAPLIEGRPLFESLQLELGARHSQYSTSGDTFAWKVGSIWEPAEGLKLRGNYQKAVRSPTIGELYEPPTFTIGDVPVDPCAGEAPVQNAALGAICLAQGAPADMIGFIESPFFGSANATTGGNPNLEFETAKTWTLGAVFQPRSLPRLTVRADYYNTKIFNAIVHPLVGDVLRQCFDPAFNPTLAVTPECTSIRRDPVFGGLEGDASMPGIPIRLTNQGVLHTDGLDAGVDYRHDLARARLHFSIIGNWTNRARFQASPISINRECVGYYSHNCPSLQPKLSFNQRTTLEIGNAAISLLWRYTDSIQLEPLAYAEQVAAATDPVTGEVDPNGVVEEEFRRIGARHYFDLTTQLEPSERLTLTLSVQNLLGSKPPIVGTGIGDTAYNSGNTFPATYDVLGRRFAVSARLRF